MSLIDSTYFQFEINIPSSDYSDLSAYITRYEREILMRALGYELYKLVAAYDSGTSPQRIKDLVEGKEYVISSSETIKWNGLVNDEKESLIAYYVFYWYVRNKIVSVQTTGVTQAKNENSNMASASQKMSAAWMKLRQLYGGVFNSEYVPSLFNFLTNFEDDYPEWVFEEIGSVNSFDL